jgi:hypothetical protein
MGQVFLVIGELKCRRKTTNRCPTTSGILMQEGVSDPAAIEGAASLKGKSRKLPGNDLK